jgi:hypothetical protein
VSRNALRVATAREERIVVSMVCYAHGRVITLRGGADDADGLDTVTVCDEHLWASAPIPQTDPSAVCPVCEERAGRQRYARLLAERPEWFE